MTISVDNDLAVLISKMKDNSEEIAKKAIYAGADIVADKIRINLNHLPEDDFRHLKKSEKFNGVPDKQKKDLQDSLGITPIATDNDGNLNAKIGFDGYGSMPTKKYPKGVPNQLIARSIESGSSVRQKTPFVRPAINATKKAAIEEMSRTAEQEIKKLEK